MRSVRARGRRMTAAVFLAGILTGGARAAEDAPARVIQYTRDTLTVHVTGAPNSEILEELSRQSGADIRGQVREPRDVAADFDSVPLPEALARLLGEQNFALVYGKGGRLKTIRLLGGAQPGSQVAGSPPSSAPSGPERPPFPGSLPALIDRHPPVPVAGALADAIGSPSATLRQLIDLSLHHEDPAVRAEALRTGIGTLDGDPELRSAVISELETADSVLLTSLLRTAASERSEDIATQVLRDTRFPEIRLKASSVLQRLRSGS